MTLFVAALGSRLSRSGGHTCGVGLGPRASALRLPTPAVDGEAFRVWTIRLSASTAEPCVSRPGQTTQIPVSSMRRRNRYPGLNLGPAELSHNSCRCALFSVGVFERQSTVLGRRVREDHSKRNAHAHCAPRVVAKAHAIPRLELR